MIHLYDHGVFLLKNGNFASECFGASKEKAREKTMAWKILEAHNHSGNMERLELKFDALVSPDNNYVSILQTARASGLERFPVPYVLSNCHNTLCAIGGTINEDDHVFGLSNVKKYGGIFVPPHRGVLHQYMREMMAGCGKMILGSDSHTRYGALGTMGIGEGGGEVVKQLLGKTYDLTRPPIIAVSLTGSPKPGVGSMDVALALAANVFGNGFVKNKILEFIGEGIEGLSMEFRMGLDVMTTECAALSSIWCTDEKTREYLKEHGREEAYFPLHPEEGAYYDGLIEIDLSQVECMIALPFHPSNAMPIHYFKEHLEEILSQVEAEGQKIKGSHGEPFSIMDHVRDGELTVDQALISGCCGGLFENLAAVSDILGNYTIPGSGPSLGVNPASLPVMSDLMNQGIAGRLVQNGVTIRPCICGPCFGVTDVPANNGLSIRHMTRNYPNREGSKPGQGQMAAAFLMDSRSIAATMRNGGRLTAATEMEVEYHSWHHQFDSSIYKGQVYDCYEKGNPQEKLAMGPNIADWPKMYGPGTHLLLKTAGSYEGSVTTDELIPSGEASSYRSNPEKISGYTMISRDPEYVGRAKEIRGLEEEQREMDGYTSNEQMNHLLDCLKERLGCLAEEITLGSLMVSDQIGDGSSREQAASCQRVLGGFANLANTYSTKRYRSNLINWGMLPLRTEETLRIPVGTYLLVPDVRKALEQGAEEIAVQVLNPRDGRAERVISCQLDHLTENERRILLAGCLMNYYKGTDRERAR